MPVASRLFVSWLTDSCKTLAASMAICTLFLAALQVRGDEPVLEKGVALSIGGSRLQSWAAPDAVDWNNDGLTDLVVGHYTGALNVYLNRGMGQARLEFEAAAIRRLDGFAAGGRPVWAWRFNKTNCVCPGPSRVSPRVLDWDRDGKKDLLIGDGRGAQIRIWKNVGTDSSPAFSTNHIQYLPEDGGIRPYHETVIPSVGDWNGDGRLDLLTGRNRGLYVYMNVGTAKSPRFLFDKKRLGDKIIGVFPDERLSVLLVDWDEDGKHDLLAGSQHGEVWFARNVGTTHQPKFAGYQRVSAGGEEIAVKSEARLTMADLDGDGLRDLILGTSSGVVWWYRGQSELPRAHTRFVRADAGHAKSFMIQGSAEARLLSYQVVRQPKHGVLSGVAPDLTYTPKAGYAGQDQFTFRVTADGKSSHPAVVAIEVVPPVKAPSISAKPKDEIAAQEPLPSAKDDVPVVDIKFKSPMIEPTTPGVLTITRGGNVSKAVTVKLVTKRAHDPVVADVHFVPTPESITLAAGQTSAELKVTPIDDTLVNGRRTLTFQIVPNPAYRIASKLGAATMVFLDDDCPQVSISVAKQVSNTFRVTALPAPRRDTEVTYTVSGNAIAGKDYARLEGSVTIPAGETSALINVRAYRSEAASSKTLTLTLPMHRFTFFDFYGYLTNTGPRTATLTLATSKSLPPAPAPLNAIEDPSATKLRREVSRLGWIVFSARSGSQSNDFDLFAMRPDGSGLRKLTNTPEWDEFSARLSIASGRLLFRRIKAGRSIRQADITQQDVSTRALATWPQQGTLVVADLDGSNADPVGQSGEFAWASWSPDGKRLACLEPRLNESSTASASKKPVPKKPSNEIVIRRADDLSVIKRMPAAGILSHAVWSPDGTRICGPANISPGRYSKGMEFPLGQGKLVSVSLESGKRTTMARFPDWYPVWVTDSDGDWFQGGTPSILHSANNYGICPAYYSMLWKSGLNGEPSQLVFGQYMKHVWGGCTSPDDRYAMFVISGDKWALEGKMAIIRLADAPIARGRSQLFHDVLADHFPDVKRGPVFDLSQVSAGFDPHWTAADLSGED